MWKTKSQAPISLFLQQVTVGDDLEREVTGHALVNKAFAVLATKTRWPICIGNCFLYSREQYTSKRSGCQRNMTQSIFVNNSTAFTGKQVFLFINVVDVKDEELILLTTFEVLLDGRTNHLTLNRNRTTSVQVELSQHTNQTSFVSHLGECVVIGRNDWLPLRLCKRLTTFPHLLNKEVLERLNERTLLAHWAECNVTRCNTQFTFLDPSGERTTVEFETLLKLFTLTNRLHVPLSNVLDTILISLWDERREVANLLGDVTTSVVHRLLFRLLVLDHTQLLGHVCINFTWNSTGYIAEWNAVTLRQLLHHLRSLDSSVWFPIDFEQQFGRQSVW
ncbi:MAG: hypothetical protein [Caudoviricetes sp.]|nr:MAG: hypothetical protein [Caudoviricetes sp.]